MLKFARELQNVADFSTLMELACRELPTSLGFHQAWLFVAEKDEPNVLRLLDSAGDSRAAMQQFVQRVGIEGNALLEEIERGDAPVLVADARTDPRTNKDLVAKLGSRTIVSVPLRLQDDTLAVFGTGTFGAEGCRPPAPVQLEYLGEMGQQIRVAADRIRFLEERRRSELALARLETHLRQSRKMEALGRLASGVAHDFNNLLSVIMSFTELAIADLSPAAPCRADLDEVVKASRRAAELTRKLLSFSHQRAIVTGSCDLGDVIAGMDGMIRRIIGADIELETTAPRPLAKVNADPSVIEQVVLNLVVNARDAMPAGGKLLVEACEVMLDAAYAGAHTGVAPGRHVMLAVSDTGCGMDAETQERMFEPFFTTKEEGRGTGIGLSSVYGLVTQAGGSVRVYSEVGNGTTVRVYIPISTAEDTTIASPLTMSVRVWGAETILLVEDDVQLRRVAKRILERHGYVVLEARSSEHALQIAEHHDCPIDLVLTDVIMPVMSGVELGSRITGLRPDAVVVYMSGYTALATQHHCGLGTELGFLMKPITPQTLLRRVRDALDESRGDREVTRAAESRQGAADEPRAAPSNPMRMSTLSP